MLAPPSPAPAAPAARRRTRVQLCGALVIEIDGHRVDARLPGHKGRQLLACLVVSRDRAMSRDELIDAIWHDESPADPDGTLSTLLTRVRSAIGRDLIRGRGELVLDLGDDARVDWDVAHASVGDAERMLAAGDADGALTVACDGFEIARRPLLPGISTPWLEERRRELVETAAALLETAGRAALRLGGEHLPTAERRARQLIEREPYRESGYALLMETHAARGNIAEALRVYDDLRRLLREELGLTPASPLTALASRLLEHHDPHPAAAGPQPLGAPLPATLAAATSKPLAGRRSELRHLVTAVTETPVDRCRVLALSGEAGSGKTRLAADVAVHAHAAGGEVVHGRAQRDAVAPLWPFVEALRRRLAHSDDIVQALLPVMRPELCELARVVPELRPALGDSACARDGELQLQLVFGGAEALFAALARRRPLLLVIEDVQWADRPTLQLLRHIAGAVAGARLTMLLTLRDDEAGDTLRAVLHDLHRDRLLDRVVLGGLDEAATTELVGRGLPPGELQALRERAGGNPFYLEELLNGEAGLPGLRDAVESRLHPLPHSVREALAAGAAVGHAFDLTAIASSTGRPRAALLEAIEDAERVGLLVRDATTAERFRFRHGLVHQTLAA